ncbi:unnamed protein product [Amoebophrya sp. A120]|nr:unnamed protein product [Amoebophrya sp. A120]|eukprot:GSA120T00005659001.1
MPGSTTKSGGKAAQAKSAEKKPAMKKAKPDSTAKKQDSKKSAANSTKLATTTKKATVMKKETVKKSPSAASVKPKKSQAKQGTATTTPKKPSGVKEKKNEEVSAAAPGTSSVLSPVTTDAGSAAGKGKDGKKTTKYGYVIYNCELVQYEDEPEDLEEEDSELSRDEPRGGRCPGSIPVTAHYTVVSEFMAMDCTSAAFWEKIDELADELAEGFMERGSMDPAEATLGALEYDARNFWKAQAQSGKASGGKSLGVTVEDVKSCWVDAGSGSEDRKWYEADDWNRGGIPAEATSIYKTVQEYTQFAEEDYVEKFSTGIWVKRVELLQ